MLHQSLWALIMRPIMHQSRSNKFQHNFTGVQIWSPFSTAVAFVLPSFQKEATHVNCIWTPGASATGLRHAHIWHTQLREALWYWRPSTKCGELSAMCPFFLDFWSIFLGEGRGLQNCWTVTRVCGENSTNFAEAMAGHRPITDLQ